MGISNTHKFSEADNRIAAICKAIGHPARVAIINYLVQQNSCICKDLVNELPLSQATISQHLKELKNIGLIKGSIEGNTICYCLDKNGFTELLHYCNPIIDILNTRKKSYC